MSAATKPAARIAILAAWAKWRRRAHCRALTRTDRLHDFVRAYAAGLTGCEAWVMEVYPSITFSTLYRWLRPVRQPSESQGEMFSGSAWAREPLATLVLATEVRSPGLTVHQLHELLRQARPDLEMPGVRSLYRHLQVCGRIPVTGPARWREPAK